jgi:TatD DNase family protein
MYIDTHTHLYDTKLAADAEQIPRALKAGVSCMLMPNCDSTTIEGMLALADKWPNQCLPMMGLHPTYVNEYYEDELAIVEKWLRQRKFYAIGEVGLDYYWDTTFKEQQQRALERQIGLAKQYQLPLVLHTREATADTIATIAAHQDGSLRGIFHCFGGSVDEARQIVDLGFHLGIGGVVTYKNTPLPEVMAAIGLEHMVLETDAPYLAPVPYRGKRNESSYLPVIAHKIAELKKIGVEEVASVTTANAKNIFNI